MDNELYPLGAVKDPKDERDILYATVAEPVASLPRKFSLRDKQSPVARQKYGSCVGFANKSACEYHRKRLLNIDEIISGRWTYGRCKELDGRPDDEGTYPRLALSVAFGKGLVLDKDFSNSKPPSPTHADYIKAPTDEITEGAIQRAMVGGFVRVRNLQELKQALVEHGTVLITVSVYTQFDNPENDGFIPWAAQRTSRGSHAIVCTGYDDDFRGVGAIEVKNNWGESWGDDGYGYIAYDYEGEGATPCWDMWVIVGEDKVNAQLTSGAPINLVYPVDTPTPFVTQAFGARPEYYKKYGMAGHNGIDFRTRDTNKRILACDDGEVIFAGNDGSYGQSVRIKHSWGMSIYAHNSQIVIPLYENDGSSPKKVKRGQHIAIAGATGDTGNPPAEHCHFGIRINGVKNPAYFDWVDPAPYLKKGERMIGYKHPNNSTVYLPIGGGTLVPITDWATFVALGGSESSIVQLSADQFAKYTVANGAVFTKA